MISYKSIIRKDIEEGEKKGWTYVVIPASVSNKLSPGQKKSYRVKGFIDSLAISQVALIPIGEGDFIIALNATMRKEIRKNVGSEVLLKLEVDHKEFTLDKDLVSCLEDEPLAKENFYGLTKGHQNYFSNWIKSAKTEPTRAKRIAYTIDFVMRGKNLGEMIRALKKSED